VAELASQLRGAPRRRAGRGPAYTPPRPAAAQPDAIRALLRAHRLQPKLTVGEPGDRYEREADAVADRVMRMSEADVAQRVEAGTVQPLRIQRRCAECAKGAGHPDPAADREERIRAKQEPGRTSRLGAGLESRIARLQRGGRPLDRATRAFFEPRFGRDFSDVRVHDGPEAARASRSINARAFTLGRHIVFGAGEHRTSSPEGKRLLGHELTHVVQQYPGIRAHFQLSQAPADQIFGKWQIADIFPSENPPTDDRCRVILGGRRIDHWTGTYLGFRHLYIDYYNNPSDYGVIEAGPVPSSASMGGGTSGAWVKPSTWEARGVQWELTPSHCPSFISCLKAKTPVYSGAGHPYHATHGPNSNSFAWWVLDQCGIDISFLVPSYPYLGVDYWTTHAAGSPAPAPAPATP